MANPLYSELLLAGSSAASIAVPAGFRWVILDVSGILQSPAGSISSAIHFSANEFRFFAVLAPPFFNRPFHWSGRQVVAEGDNLSVDLDHAPTVTWAVTGWQLTTP